jgi:signal transduction histidine kinase
VIERLLTRLDNPRRHLTFLVGLLVLVFVLTAVVAWRANTAERDRAAIARNTLKETADMALNDWNSMFRLFVGNDMPAVATMLADSRIPLESLTSRVRVRHVCRDCDTTRAVRSAFTIDPLTQDVSSTGDILPEGVAAVIVDHLEAGNASRFHELLFGGLYFVEVEGTITTALVAMRINEALAPVRIAGIVIDEATSREMLELAFAKARVLQTALAPHATVNELFARSVLVGDASLISHGSSDMLETIKVETPVYGLTLALGPERSSAGFVEFGADPVADRLTVIVLMLMISTLLVMALLQVRRESRLTRLRADFVSSVSHELRTPLAQIRMFTETLLLGRVRSDVERRRSLEIIDQEARRLAYLVENVLLFSKTDGGRQPRVAPEPTQFAEEVRHAVESFSLLSRNREVEVRTELQENITVEVDRMALRQILINLVDNALKYGPAGQRITVGAALFDDVARLWVDDEGDGIPAEERARVFDSFYRLPRDQETRVTGSGIGLAVVRELARLHGGDAWAEAAPGRGARIVVQFPDAYVRSKDAGDLAAAS